jgi:hypothetical protein
MKRMVAIAFTLLSLYSGAAQSFEGKVIYKNSFKSKSAGLKDEQLDTMFGNIQDYYIKGSDYKSVSNGTFLQAQLYISKENKFLSKTANADTFQSIDASINQDEILKTELQKGILEVLGYPCDELILTCKSGIQKYYFNSKLPIEAEQFKGHQYANWYAYLKLSGALPLKMIIDNQQFHLESQAIEVLPMVLVPDEFQLAADRKTFKITLQDWTPLETKVFKISFPIKPIEDIQTVKTEIGDLRVKNYTYDVPSFEPDPNIMYSVAETDYPDSLINSYKTELLDQFFEESIKSILNSVQGRLLVESNMSIDDFPGREIKIDFHNGLAIIKVRMFLVKNKMIMLQTITYSKNDLNNSVDKFMNSFSLNK